MTPRPAEHIRGLYDRCVAKLRTNRPVPRSRGHDRHFLCVGLQSAPVIRSISRLISLSLIGLRRNVFHASIPIPSAIAKIG